MRPPFAVGNFLTGRATCSRRARAPPPGCAAPPPRPPTHPAPGRAAPNTRQSQPTSGARPVSPAASPAGDDQRARRRTPPRAFALARVAHGPPALFPPTARAFRRGTYRRRPTPHRAPRAPRGAVRRSRPPPRQPPRRRHAARHAAPRTARRPGRRAANTSPKRPPSPHQGTTKSRPRNQPYGRECGRPLSLRREFRFSRTQEIIHGFSRPLSVGGPPRARPERDERGQLPPIQCTNNRHDTKELPFEWARRSPGEDFRFSRLYQFSATPPPNPPALHPVTTAPAAPGSPCVKP